VCHITILNIISPTILNRNDQNPNYPKIKDTLLAAREGQDKHGVKVAQLEAGTLSIFCGHNSMHRVTKIGGEKSRFVGVLSYEKEPDVYLDDYTKLKFCGRLK
jgi:hypothetical protein